MLFTGVDYHVTQIKEDIIVSLRYMDRLLGLDTSAKTVTVEPGMKVTSPFLTASKWAGPAWAVAELAWGRVSSVSSVQVNTRLSLVAVIVICALIG